MFDINYTREIPNSPSSAPDLPNEIFFFQNNPDLRLTWLESMAKNNEDHEHYAEAAMCKVIYLSINKHLY